MELIDRNGISFFFEIENQAIEHNTFHASHVDPDFAIWSDYKNIGLSADDCYSNNHLLPITFGFPKQYTNKLV